MSRRKLYPHERDTLARKSHILQSWATHPEDPYNQEGLWQLAHCDSEAAALIVQAFDTPLAEAFGRKSLYSFSAIGNYYCPDFWRVVGATLKWLPRNLGGVDPAVFWHFLINIAPFRENLTEEEKGIWTQKLVDAGTPEILNFLGDHGIIEAIPPLERRVTTLPNGSRTSVGTALLNGYDRVACYNLLRLIEIKAAKQRREARRKNPTAA